MCECKLYQFEIRQFKICGFKICEFKICECNKSVDTFSQEHQLKIFRVFAGQTEITLGKPHTYFVYLKSK